jgi:membrane protease YdiL (CAAX protease family)
MILEEIATQIVVIIAGVAGLLFNKKYKFFRLQFDNHFTTTIIPIVSIVLLQSFHFFFVGGFVKPDALLLFALITAPLFEEVIFRGYIIGLFYTQHHARFWIIFGICLSSLLFMVAHGGLSWYRFVSGFIFSLLFVCNKRNLFPSIIAHFTNNLYVLFV